MTFCDATSAVFVVGPVEFAFEHVAQMSHEPDHSPLTDALSI